MLTLRRQLGVRWIEPASLVHWTGTEAVLWAHVGDRVVALDPDSGVVGLHFHDLPPGPTELRVRTTGSETRGLLQVPSGAEVWVKPGEDGPRMVRMQVWAPSSEPTPPNWSVVGMNLSTYCD